MDERDANAAVYRQAVGELVEVLPAWAADLPLGWIDFTVALIAAVVAVGLVFAAWIWIWAKVVLVRRARRVPPTMYLPRHPLRKAANRRRSWGERWIEHGGGERPQWPKSPWSGS